MNNQIAVLFTKELDKVKGVYHYKPIEVIEGELDIDLCIFTDKNEIEHNHITEEGELDNLEEVSFGYNFNIVDLKVLLKTNDLDLIKESLLSIIQEYQIQRKKTSNVVNVKRNNEALFEEYYDNYTDLMDNAFQSLQEEMEEESLPTNIKKADVEEKISEIDIETIYKNITKKIIGQDDAIKKLITSIYVAKTSNIKNNILIIGKSGVGKTKTLELLSQEFDCDLSVFDVSALTQSGFVGRSSNDIFVDLYTKCDGNIKKMENAIVALDEIDKKCNNSNETEIAVSKGFTQELLGVLNGGVYTFETKPNSAFSDNVTIDTSKIIFIASGAFVGIDEKFEKHVGFGETTSLSPNYQNITDDMLIQYGMYPELLGRLPIKVPFNSLTAEDYQRILLESEISPLKQQINYLKEKFNVELLLEDEVITKIAKLSVEKGIGTRALGDLLGQILYNEVLYKIITAKTPYKKLTIKKEIFNNPKGYVLQ